MLVVSSKLAFGVEESGKERAESEGRSQETLHVQFYASVVLLTEGGADDSTEDELACVVAASTLVMYHGLDAN